VWRFLVAIDMEKAPSVLWVATTKRISSGARIKPFRSQHVASTCKVGRKVVVREAWIVA
jgi:hypothetical protein